LGTAINGQADTIVTFNRADFVGFVEEFGVQVLSPMAALRRMDVK